MVLEDGTASILPTKGRSTAPPTKTQSKSLSQVTEEKKAFPFFRLAKELRDMVYEEVFQNASRDGVVTPDPHHYRRHDGVTSTDRTVNNGLALLLSCQQVHDEATTILYGNRVFYFDDIRHGDFSCRIDVTAHCYYCRRIRGPTPFEGWNYGDRCYDADGFGLKHEILIPYCDFIAISHWLSVIGARNRLLIRQIQLHFTTSQFTKVLGAVHWGGEPGKPSPVGGEFVERGLQAFALGHNLETMTISFEVPKQGEYNIDLKEAPVHIFSAEHRYSDRLEKALCNITGIKTLVCEPRVGEYTVNEYDGSIVDFMAGVREKIREIKGIMEAGHETRTRHEVNTAWSSR